MTPEKAFEIVSQQLVNRFEIPEDKVTPQATLFKELGMDSIDALDMVGLLEAELNIKVNEEELRKLRTVQDVVDYVVRHQPATV